MKEKRNNKAGLITLVICSIIAVLIIVISIFFPEKIVNLIKK